jgi:hypothetical protein
MRAVVHIWATWGHVALAEDAVEVTQGVLACLPQAKGVREEGGGRFEWARFVEEWLWTRAGWLIGREAVTPCIWEIQASIRDSAEKRERGWELWDGGRFRR